MPREKRKKHLRRCAVCNKIGHNKSTCTERTSSTISKAPTTPLKFFVHHVNYAPQHSDHVLDLKKKDAHVWQQVEAVAPEAVKTEPEITTPSSIENALPPTPTFSSKLPDHLPTSSEVPTYHSLFSKPLNSQPEEKIKLPEKPLFKPAPFHDSVEKKINQFFVRATTPKKLVAAATLTALFAGALFLPQWALGYYSTLEQSKKTILDQSTAGFMDLQESTVALKKADFTAANDATERALEKFSNALKAVDDHKVLQTIVTTVPVVRGEVMSRENILLAGDELAVANKTLLEGIQQIQQNPSTTFALKINTLNSALSEALPDYQKAEKNLESVDPSTLPLQYQASFNDFRTIFSAAISDFSQIHDVASHFQEIFGGNGFRRYLLVFQNESELRPTGGFMGSYAIMDIRDGKITNLTIPPGGTYDVQGQLSVSEEPPTPLSLINKRWEMQDANWYPDFPASAEQTMWFYRKSRNTTVDGVIAINAHFLTRLLQTFGPVTDSANGISLDADNALATIQAAVETGPDKAQGKPKQIITDLAPQLLNTFTTIDAHALLPLLGSVQEALREKEIQLYFTDPTTQSALSEYGWTGEIKKSDPDQDYLMVVDTNIGGQKSDAKIKQSIAHQAVVQSDGSIIDTVTITRQHSGVAGEKFYGETNVDYLRVYAPQGSELISARGFSWPSEKSFKIPENWYTKDDRLTATEKEVGIEPNSGTRITNEFGKTAFGNWMITEPGQTSQVQITYRLPFTLSALAKLNNSNPAWNRIEGLLNKNVTDYQLMVQKQSGITSDFESQIIFPENWHPIWKEGDAISLANNGGVISSIPLTTDQLFALLMQSEN